MSIKIFWHVAVMNHWHRVIRTISKSIRSSGLLEHADQIIINLAGTNRATFGIPFSMCYNSKITEFEFPALDLVKEKTSPGDQVLYIHTKGVSNPREPWKTSNQNWLEFMLWGCVENWREMVASLNSHDVAGVNWIDKPGEWGKKCGAPGFFGGNFWWSRGDYIQRLRKIPKRKWNNRWLAEGWIGRGEPRVFDLKNLTQGNLIQTETFMKKFQKENFQKPQNFIKIPRPVKPRKRDRVRGRNEVINYLIKKHGYKSYLEIGVLSGWNFKRIECPYKISVDPSPKCEVSYRLTSDEYFSRVNEKFDIVFIDGLHTEKQVAIDIENALERLNEGGMIVCHDCLPETPFQCRDIPEYDGDWIWTGTSWEAFAKLRMTRTDLWQAVVDVDFGVGLIRPGKQELFPEMELSFRKCYRYFPKLLNIIEPDDFLEREET